jgi:hypothetical protein
VIAVLMTVGYLLSAEPLFWAVRFLDLPDWLQSNAIVAANAYSVPAFWLEDNCEWFSAVVEWETNMCLPIVESLYPEPSPADLPASIE